ncbi:extracellular solute-binding protein [Rhodococcus opacus]|nr:extracellular solute-binding protein [Rhodococcus opacus]
MMKRASKFAGLVAIVGVALTSVSACSSTPAAEVVTGPWGDVVAAAEAEGHVNLYSVAPPVQNARLVEAFNEQFPDISVTVTRGTGELPGRVQSEIRSASNGADVFLYTDPQFFVNLSDDLLDVNGPATIGWDDDFWAEKGKSIIVTKYPWTILVWNTNTFPNGFSNWQDLLSPDAKGKIGMYRESSISNLATVEYMRNELGSDYLMALGEQDPKYYSSVVTMNQAIASGEIGVTMFTAPSIVTALQAQGAPMDFKETDPLYALQWAGGAPATSKRPNAARVFLDFVMSEAGQNAINGGRVGRCGAGGNPRCARCRKRGAVRVEFVRTREDQ